MFLKQKGEYWLKDDWAKILDNHGQVDAFILDFEKAFDTPTLMNFSKANCLAMELEVKL